MPIEKEKEKLQLSSDYLRYLSLYAIERAKSGHPGLPLGCAEFAVCLYKYHLKYSHENRNWPNRDRFILSAGHGSMLLYSILHLNNYDITLEDIKEFRQYQSKTPGHPEYEDFSGIETTTGPLGQGFANSVGLAINAKIMSERFNRKETELFNYNIYTLVGDGCLMEGISYEATSIAGFLNLDNLICIYDSNNITIDGGTEITFNENIEERFKAQGWEVFHCQGQNIESINNSLKLAKNKNKKPKLIVMKTTIGYGLKEKANSSAIHGAPAGIEEICYFIKNSTISKIYKNKYGKDILNNNQELENILKKEIKEGIIHEIPEIKDFFNNSENDKEYKKWNSKLKSYQKKYPDDYNKLLNCNNKAKLPSKLREALLYYKHSKTGDATRNISGSLLNICSNELPNVYGGCADLSASTKAYIKDKGYMTKVDFSSKNIAFGIREHAMAAINNGLALSKNLYSFSSTFLSFFDYLKPSLRLSAIMKLKHLYLFSHDSIYVGEDGPTHQPIEHINSLRLLPDFYTFRPANDSETAWSFLYFLERSKGPCAIITSRQGTNLNLYNERENKKEIYSNFLKGGYIYHQSNHEVEPEIIVAASGTEMGLAYECCQEMEEVKKLNIRLISLPSLDLLAENRDYAQEIFNDFKKPVIIIEALSYRTLWQFFNKNILLIDIQEFGISAPAKEVANHFGFTKEKILEKISNYFDL